MPSAVSTSRDDRTRLELLLLSSLNLCEVIQIPSPSVVRHVVENWGRPLFDLFPLIVKSGHPWLVEREGVEHNVSHAREDYSTRVILYASRDRCVSKDSSFPQLHHGFGAGEIEPRGLQPPNSIRGIDQHDRTQKGSLVEVWYGRNQRVREELYRFRTHQGKRKSVVSLLLFRQGQLRNSSSGKFVWLSLASHEFPVCQVMQKDGDFSPIIARAQTETRAKASRSCITQIGWGLPIGLVYNIKDVKLYFMTSREIIKLLQDNGWVIERVRGSHHVMSHPDNPKLVVVPHPRKDFPIGTLRSIERVSGVKLR